MRQVYLDNNATSPLDSRVLQSMLPYLREDFGNASSIHSYGQKARAAVEEARQQVARLVGAEPKEIVFTSGGTESDNAALRGVACHQRSRGDHIITTTIEHPAVLRSCEQLQKEGYRVSYIPVDRDGIVRLDKLKDAIDEKTVLISVMYANNETGAVQPIEEIAGLAREGKIIFHSDAVQAIGKVPVNIKDLGVDLISISAHKLHGPKGVGALYVRRGISMTPFMFGGSHERSRRAGTENVPGIVGLGTACELAIRSLEDFNTRVRALRDRLEEGILIIPEVIVNGTRTQRMPHVSNVSFRYLEGEALLISLDFQGIAVSTGAACASGSLQPSHVLKAMGLESELVDGAIRFSLSRMTTEEDIDYVLQVLPGIIERMREMSPLYRNG